MSYLKYVELYANSESNYGRFTKRGRKDNYWLNTVKLNQKLDIFDGDRRVRDECWHIGTVLKIEGTNNSIKFHMHYDGYSAKFDEWVNIDYSTTTSIKLKPLHTFTPKHLYLTDESYHECTWQRNKSSWKKCDICNAKCCIKCCIMKDDETDQYLCKQCMKSLDHGRIFNAIHTAIAHQFTIDINIIYLLTDYAMGYILKCCNRSKQHQCPNPVLFPSRFALEISARGKSYHYITNISSANTEYIFGENMRIFCENCTENCLSRCFKCSGKDLQRSDGERIVCYRHGYGFRTCTICNYSYSASPRRKVTSFSTECSEYHCRNCINDRRGACYLCSYGTYNCLLRKCVECEEFVCDVHQFKCVECDAVICEGCKTFYGWTKCRKCSNGNSLCINKHQILVQSTKNGDNWRMYEQDMGTIDELRKVDDRYTRNGVSKKRQKKKKLRKKMYRKNRLDTISNMKQKKRFDKRYGLLLQY